MKIKLVQKFITSCLVFLAFLAAFFITHPIVHAGEGAPCDTLICLSGQTKQSVAGSSGLCQCVTGADSTNNSSTGEDVFGTIQAPAAVAKYNAAAKSVTGSDIGLVLFVSNMIRIATIIAGVWVMVNFILAGWTYIISTGDSKAHSDASSKMTFSLVGLAIIVGSYTLAALIGLVFFGDATYILNPKLTGVTGG